MVSHEPVLRKPGRPLAPGRTLRDAPPVMVFGLSSSDGSSSEDEVADRDAEVLPPSSIPPSTPAADSGEVGANQAAGGPGAD